MSWCVMQSCPFIARWMRKRRCDLCFNLDSKERKTGDGRDQLQFTRRHLNRLVKHPDCLEHSFKGTSLAAACEKAGKWTTALCEAQRFYPKRSRLEAPHGNIKRHRWDMVIMTKKHRDHFSFVSCFRKALAHRNPWLGASWTLFFSPRRGLCNPYEDVVACATAVSACGQGPAVSKLSA